MAAPAYPVPPPFFKLYKDYSTDPESTPAPPPPIVGTYTMFGVNYTTDERLPALEDLGLTQLYPKGPNVDFTRELKALNRELCLQFLELVDVLVDRPSQYARRVEDMGLILRNMHHLLNALRPHQARASIIHILELQIQQRKQAVADIRRKREEVRHMLQDSLQALEGQMNGTIRDGSMGSTHLDPNMAGQKNGASNYGFVPDQAYR